MIQNGVPKPKTENAWQVHGRLSPLLFIYAYYNPRSLLLSFVEVLKKAAIPAIVLCSQHKQAKNSMAGCCNNLP
jgi:hypothetical protein